MPPASTSPEKGMDYLENYVREVREVIGYEIPLAVDHPRACSA